jgi:hypothetical protein
MTIASYPRTLTQPKKIGTPMLEIIFQRKCLPDHRYCLRLWSPNHAEIIDTKVLLKSIKHSINVSPYYFLLLLLLHNGLYLMYHTLFSAQSRTFWSHHWNCSQGLCPLALSRHAISVFEIGLTGTEFYKGMSEIQRCCFLWGWI